MELSALNGAERLNAFYKLWTRKESIIKARGEGLGVLSSINGSLSFCEGLRIFDLQAPTGFAAALSVEVPQDDIEIQLKALNWPLTH